MKKPYKAPFLIVYMLSILCFSPQASALFSVEGKNLVDANGNIFVMRGINHPHTWYPDKTSALADISATGANTVRIVLSNGNQWSRNDGPDVASLISLCKTQQLICVLEVHDSTGFGESSGATHISNATQYWLASDIQEAITGEEDYVIINIANEPFGNHSSESTYVNDTIAAIQALRNGGLRHTIMVDAGNWGQDWQHLMRDNAPQIFNADPDRNVIFDVHMYEVYGSRSKIQSYMQAFADNDLALVVGEFGATHAGQFVDVDSILELAEQFGYGYLGWSWSGNGSCCTQLDIVNNFDPNSKTQWGTRLIDGPNGIASTATPASVFNDDPNDGGDGGDGGDGTVAYCSWTDGTIWPICSNDNGSWGWENNQSCISESACPASNTPDDTDSSENCIWSDGTTWPLCQNETGSWGWENNTSCVSRSICPSLSPEVNAPTQCRWVNGTIWPLCANEQHGWGWENQQSCISLSICPDTL